MTSHARAAAPRAVPRRRALVAAIAAVALPRVAAAADRPLTIVVPYPAGGAIDHIARIVAERLSVQLARPVLIANRGGASGTLGTAWLARAEPDGDTVGMGSISTLALAPLAYPNPGYDAERSFAPIGQIGAAPMLVVASAALGVSGIDGLIALLGRRPGGLNYTSPGEGSVPDVAARLFLKATGRTAVHVPYSSGSSLLDLLAGRVHLRFDQIAAFGFGQLHDPRLRVLAVMSPRRLASLPQVPTLRESGLDGLDFELWSGLIAPAATPAAVVATLNDNLRRALRDAAVRAALQADGVEARPGSPEAFAMLIAQQRRFWSAALR